ncbi:MAG: molybdopterin-dependent oxidoreductase [Rhodothermales bacterium]
MKQASSTPRREFIKKAGSTLLGLSILPMVGCEKNSFEPILLGTDIPFLSPIQHNNPDEAFFIQYGGEAAIPNWPGVQQLSRNTWSMIIDGLVDTSLQLTFADIQQESDKAVRILSTLRCIVDETFVPGLIGTTIWTGVPLRIFLDRAGIDPVLSKRIRFYGSDGFTNNLKFNQIYGPIDQDLVEPLLVYEMNGVPLTPEHGNPVRLLVPGAYGYKSVKWLNRIEVSGLDEVFGSYQEQLGYVDDGEVSVINKVTNPLQGQTISAGAFKLFGYALSGKAGIRDVQLSFNDGPFESARILPLSEVLSSNPQIRETVQLQDAGFAYPFRGVWTLWESTWNATPGSHTIRVRATDNSGNSQPFTDENDLDGTNPVFELRVNVE